MALSTEELEALATPPFATISDLEKRYKKLKDDEKDVAEVLLEDASNLILAQLPYGWEKIERTVLLLKQVTCDLVRRKMTSSTGTMAMFPAANQVSLTTGSVTQSVSMVNPYGNMKLTPEEKRLLGISRQKIMTIDPTIGWGREDESS